MTSFFRPAPALGAFLALALVLPASAGEKVLSVPLINGSGAAWRMVVAEEDKSGVQNKGSLAFWDDKNAMALPGLEKLGEDTTLPERTTYTLKLLPRRLDPSKPKAELNLNVYFVDHNDDWAKVRFTGTQDEVKAEFLRTSSPALKLDSGTVRSVLQVNPDGKSPLKSIEILLPELNPRKPLGKAK